MTTTPQQRKPLQWWQFPITRTQAQGDPGIDFGTRFHTPITALLPGTVSNITHGGWGLEVDVAGPRATTESYVHLDQLASNIHIGSQVTMGQFLGLSGGQLVGGSNPATSTFSSGPHSEFDIFQGTPWQSPTVDPRPFFGQLASLLQTSLGAVRTGASGVGDSAASVGGSLGGVIGNAFGAVVTPVSQTAANIGQTTANLPLPVMPGIAPALTSTGSAVASSLDIGQRVQQVLSALQGVAVRAGLISIGVLLLFIVVIMLLIGPPDAQSATITRRQVARSVGRSAARAVTK